MAHTPRCTQTSTNTDRITKNRCGYWSIPGLRHSVFARPKSSKLANSAAAAKAMQGKKVAGLVGDLAPVEAVYALKELVESLGGSVECRTDNAKLPAGNRSGYAGTASIEDIDSANKILLIARTAEPGDASRPIDGLSLFFTDLDRSKVGTRDLSVPGDPTLLLEPVESAAQARWWQPEVSGDVDQGRQQ